MQSQRLIIVTARLFQTQGSGGDTLDDDSMMAASPMGASLLDGIGLSSTAAAGMHSSMNPYAIAGPDGFGYAWKSSGMIVNL